jgi:short-chain fatty acids transporter
LYALLRILTNTFDALVRRFLPDPFLFAAILTFVVFLAGILFTPSTPIQMVQFWGGSLWNLLTFAMQMALVLVLGFVLASSPIFKKMLISAALKLKTPGKAIVAVSLVSAIACWLNWGFGLVIGALFARQIAKVVPNVDYRILIASAYSGFLVWHGGLSGSIPLTIATDGHFTQELIGIIPTSETIFAPFNLIISFGIIIALPIVNRLMMKKIDEVVVIDPSLLEDHTEFTAASTDTARLTPADRLENSQIVSIILSILGFTYVVLHFMENGFDLNLNIVNLILFSLAVLLHRTPIRFLNSVQEGVKGAGGIIIQFPIYAGIMGMMIGSGLAANLTNWFVSISNEFTFPLYTFISASIINFFVPSGGGQWAVQGQIVLDAALELGVSSAKAAMAVAWGDALTNMIQPFWALPMLAIAGLRAKDIMGFCIVTMLVSGVIIGVGLTFF